MKKLIFPLLASIWLTLVGHVDAQSLWRFEKTPAPSETEYLVIPDVETLLEAPAQLQVTLPGGAVQSFGRSYIEKRPSGLLWIGEDRRGSQLLVTLEQGLVFARIESSEGVFGLGPQPYSSAKAHLLKSPRAAPEVESFCGTEPAHEATGSASISGSAQSSAPGSTFSETPGDAALKADPQIDTLVLYTSQALQAYGLSGVVGWAQTSMDLTNAAFRNSQMPARLRLVGVRRAEFQETGAGRAALTWLRNSQQARNLRNEVGADAVGFILERANDLCGVAATIPSGNIGSFNSLMYQVTQIPCINSQTFSHEMGHLFGMEHDPVNGRPVAFASFPWSYGHFVDGQFRTVMSYRSECTNENCPRVAYFSSPAIRYQGVPTGIAGERDNRRTGLSITPIIANFRQPVSGEPPDAPSDLEITAASAFRVELGWTDRSSNENGFEIERATVDTPFTQIATVSAGITSFLDDTVEAETDYSYRVRAQNGFGVSGYTNSAEITTSPPDTSSCETDDSVLCLLNGRFEVRVSWRDFESNTGPGRVLQGFSDQSAIFWFFTQDNWEMMVKMVDACTFNGHYWIFSAATTNVEYTIEVRDTETGRTKTYANDLGVSAAAVTDTMALATCSP